MIIAETAAGVAAAVPAGASGAAPVPIDLLKLFIIGALLGAFGQGLRAVVGLKGVSDEAKAQGLSFYDLFEAARLLTSLLIGGLVGLASALVYYKAYGAVTPDATTCFAWAAAGYAGTDALEGFISQYLAPGASTPTVKLHPASIGALTTQLAAALSPSPFSIVQTAFQTAFNRVVTKSDTGTKLGGGGLNLSGNDFSTLEAFINPQLDKIAGATELGVSAVTAWQASGATLQTVVDSVTKALP
jgi:hypothetical protein